MLYLLIHGSFILVTVSLLFFLFFSLMQKKKQDEKHVLILQRTPKKYLLPFQKKFFLFQWKFECVCVNFFSLHQFMFKKTKAVKTKI